MPLSFTLVPARPPRAWVRGGRGGWWSSASGVPAASTAVHAHVVERVAPAGAALHAVDADVAGGCAGEEGGVQSAVAGVRGPGGAPVLSVGGEFDAVRLRVGALPVE